VVASPGAEPLVPDGVRVVRDRIAFEGPLSGLLAGLMEARAPTVIVAGGDMPWMVEGVLAMLLAELDAEPVTSVRGDRDRVDAVILESEGRGRPLPMVLRRDPALIATAGLLDAGGRRLRAVADALDGRLIESSRWQVLDPEGLTLHDIDEPADLA
jgi:molybdopterin-guanine dinucleotide biosynthesis protein A